MSKDELLQNALEALENGAALEQVLAALPVEERAELGALLALSMRIRAGALETVLNPLSAQAQQRRVSAAAREHSAAGPARRGPHLPKWAILPKWAGLPKPAWVGLSLLALAAVSMFALLLTSAASARAATLVETAGIVETAAQGAQDWTPAADGAAIAAGARIRTRLDSSATLVFYDGSRTTLAPQTTLELEQVSGGWGIFSGRALRVRFFQSGGSTGHSVVPLQGADSFFEVRTPAGSASVRGTKFDVSVGGDGAARFAVDRGVVAVSQGGSQVLLNAGQATAAEPERRPEPAAFRFTLQGVLSAIDGETWTVNGLFLRVTADLSATLQAQPGDEVLARGRILPDGSYTVDSLAYARNGKVNSHLTGIVEAVGADTWTISGQVFQLQPGTRIEAGIALQDTVEVGFRVAGKNTFALEIGRLNEGETEEVQDTPPPALETSAAPETGPTPTPGTGADTTASGAVEPPAQAPGRAGCAAQDRPRPEGLSLAARWDAPYAEIMGWFCQGFGFGEIDLAYEIARAAEKPAGEVFALKTGGMGWGQVKQALSPQPAANDSPAAADTPPALEQGPTPQTNPNGQDKPTKEPKPGKELKATKEPKNSKK